MWRRETRSSKQTPLNPGAYRYDATLRNPNGGRSAQDEDGGPVYGGAQQELDDQERLAQSEGGGTALDPDRTPRSIPQAPSMPPSKTPSSRSSNRSESPDKMAGLRNNKGGLDYVMIDIDEILANEEHALHELADVLDRLEAFSRGVGVIPPDMLEVRQDPRVHRELRYDYPFDPSTQRAALGQAPDISNVVRLSTSTEVCQVEQEPEPAWNCAVHWPLAQLALDLSIHTDNVLLKNITVARIQPTELAPKRISGAKLQSRMVDLAYVLKPSVATAAGFANLNVRGNAPSESFNQSCLNTIIDKPLAFSIETKASNVAGDQGLLQITIWAHAQFARLRQLVNAAHGEGQPVPRLLALLLAIVNGATWTFFAASQDKHGKLTLWRYRNEISTNSKIGVYQAVAALQLMLNWAQTIFRPWFEASALPLTPAQRTVFGLRRA